MKIRQGFVSNSSSSSFVIFASQEAFDAALAECSEIEKKIAKLFLCDSPKEFLGKKVLSYSYCTGNNGDYFYDQVREALAEEENEEEEDEDKEDEMQNFAFGEFESKVAKKAQEMGEGVLTDSQDW